MTKQWTQEELDAITEQTRAWAASPEGQQQIRDAVADAEKTIAELERAIRIPWWRLHEPVTL
jgi:hypothetical protein